MNIQDAIKKVIECQNLTFDESYSTMNAIMTGNATPAQISCFITALRMKKETPEEIAGLALAMRRRRKTHLQHFHSFRNYCCRCRS